MTSLFLIAALAGILAYKKPNTKVPLGTGPLDNSGGVLKKIQLSNVCDKFVAPAQLKSSGFGYDDRKNGLSGLFLAQYEWKNEYETQIDFLFDAWTYSIKNDFSEELIFTTFIPESITNLMGYFYGKKCTSPIIQDKNTISLIEYLEIDCAFLILLILRKSEKINDETFSKGIDFIIQDTIKNYFIYTNKEIKINNINEDIIVDYYSKLFKLLPEFKKINPIYLSEIEVFKSSILYTANDNKYRFCKYDDVTIKKCIKLIAKAQYET